MRLGFHELKKGVVTIQNIKSIKSFFTKIVIKKKKK